MSAADGNNGNNGSNGNVAGKSDKAFAQQVSIGSEWTELKIEKLWIN